MRFDKILSATLFFLEEKKIGLRFSGNSLGIFWAFFENFGEIFGEFFGNSMGILWEFFGNSLGILWEFFKNFGGIVKNCLHF